MTTPHPPIPTEPTTTATLTDRPIPSSSPEPSPVVTRPTSIPSHIPPPSDGSLPAATQSTTAPAPAPTQSQEWAFGAEAVVGYVLSGAVLAALVTGTFNRALARRKSLEEERARLRSAFAEAFEVVLRYKEMPYAIRRRRHDEPGAERVRLSDQMLEIQARLAYFELWITGESAVVGGAYSNLVANLRSVAGQACRDAWIADPAKRDEQMNIGPHVIDLSELQPYEQNYVQAVQQHLDDFMKFHRMFWPLRQPRTQATVAGASSSIIAEPSQ
jgi:hypothetical protein